MIQTKIKKRFALVTLFLSFIINSHAQIMQGGVAANAISLDVNKLYDFAEGYAVVAKNGQTALINFKGEIVIDFKNKYTPVADENVAMPKYLGLFDVVGFHNGFLAVKDGSTGKIGFVNNKLELVIPCQFDIYTAGSSIQLYESYSTCFSSKGRCIVLFQGNPTLLFSDGTTINLKSLKLSNLTMPVHPAANLGFSWAAEVDYTTKNIFFDLGYTDFLYSDLARFRLNILERSNGKSPSANSGFLNKPQYGYCDLKGKVVIQNQFALSDRFYEGLAAVQTIQKNGDLKWGYIDEKGTVVIEPKYTLQPNGFHDGLALVFPSDRSEFDFGVVNPKGELLSQQKYYNNKPPLPFFNNGWLQLDENVFMSSGDFSVFDVNKGNSAMSAIKSYRVTPIPVEQVYLSTINITAKDCRFYSNLDKRLNYPLFYKICNANVDMQKSPKKPYIKGGKGILGDVFQVIIPPIFEEIGFFDERASLVYASFRTQDNKIIEGYVDRTGTFKIIKAEKSKW